MIKEMACIVCPMSCHLKVALNEKGEVLSVSGNTCNRGEQYAYNEMTHPMRMVTSTVKIEQAPYKRLPVILSGEIPKEKMFEVMEEMNKITVQAPVRIKDVLMENVCGLSVDILAGRSMEKTKRQ